MFTIVRQGDRIAVWNRQGGMEIVDGPRRLFTLNKRVQRLRHYNAQVNQYLAVKCLDGTVQHLAGPAALWFDPLVHQEIEVADALAVDANEAVVVYARNGERVERRVVRGPWMYTPAAGEWLHQFRWHGAGPDGGRKVPRALQFTKLRVIPDQMYHDVDEVRTADDALVVVKLMVFFELADIETMLDQTHDPVADFINALAADVVAFAGTRLFDDFKRDGDALNDLAHYPNLMRRAEAIGYRVNKVVYRGYAAGAKLQAMHDNAIEARTGLKLEAETERQAQDLADLKQGRELERQARERDDETAKNEHALALRRRDKEEELRHERNRARQEAELELEAETARLENLRAENREREQFLRALAETGVDTTRYLVAQYQNPDRIIRIDGTPAAVHLENV